MKRSLWTFTIVLLSLAMMAVPALAEKKPPTVKLLDLNLTPAPIDLGLDRALSSLTCNLGNINPAAFAITGFALPPEEYGLIFDPAATCGSCLMGFDINTIHFLVRTSQACTIAVDVSLVSADGTDAACSGSSPGTIECSSGAITVEFPAGGVFDVGLPIDCPCADVNYPYSLNLEYISSSCLPEPDLITDDQPTACTSWNDFGGGWVDIISDFGFPGNLSFYAEAGCCESPIPTKASSWGAIKGLFEN